MSEPHDNDSNGVDDLIIGAVDSVRNRFGAAGLRQLIDVAQVELADTEKALAELAESDSAD